MENIDGDTPAQAAARFRSGFKKDIYIALAIGWAGQLVVVGTRPFKSRYDAAGGSASSVQNKARSKQGDFTINEL